MASVASETYCGFGGFMAKQRNYDVTNAWRHVLYVCVCGVERWVERQHAVAAAVALWRRQSVVDGLSIRT